MATCLEISYSFDLQCFILVNSSQLLNFTFSPFTFEGAI